MIADVALVALVAFPMGGQPMKGVRLRRPALFPSLYVCGAFKVFLRIPSMDRVPGGVAVTRTERNIRNKSNRRIPTHGQEWEGAPVFPSRCNKRNTCNRVTGRSDR